MATTEAEYIRTVFKVYKLCVDPTACVVALYGSHSCIGEWKKEDALFFQYIGMSEWQTETLLPKNATLSYKLLLLHPRTRHVLQAELFTRHLDTNDTRLRVELTFDDLSCKTRAMNSTLTRSGSPVALRLPNIGVMEQIGEPKMDTDFLMRDPQERSRFDKRSSHAELAAALERPDALYERHQASKVVNCSKDVHVQTDMHGYMMEQVPSSTMSVDVGTNTDMMSRSSMRHCGSVHRGVDTLEYMKKRVIAEYHVPKVHANEQDVNNNSVSFRQLLPSPYRIAMLGLAAGACMYSKLQS